MEKQYQADLSLLFITIGWGATFLLSKTALDDLPVFNFLWLIFLIAFLVSILLFFSKWHLINLKLLTYSFIVGSILFSSYSLQLIGLKITTIQKSAFITSFSVILVPLISALMYKKVLEKNAAVGSIIAFIGLSFLSFNDLSPINRGDLLTFAAALGYAIHIIAVNHFTKKTDSILLAIFEIGVVGFLSLAVSLMFEKPRIPDFTNIWFNLLFLSLFCTAGAYIVETIAQNYTTPTHAAIIYSAEPVFATLFGLVFAHEILTLRSAFGGMLIIIGMIFAEIDILSFVRKSPPSNFLGSK